MGDYLYEMSKHSLQFKKAKEIKGGCKVKGCNVTMASDGFCLEHRAIYRLQEERANTKRAKKIAREQAAMEASEPRSTTWIRFVSGGMPR
jgi:hypothetical protein